MQRSKEGEGGVDASIPGSRSEEAVVEWDGVYGAGRERCGLTAAAVR